VPPLLERLRADEDRTGVRAVGARRAGEARKCDREPNARSREDDLAGTPYDRVRTLERCAVGELDRDDQVALVLRRNEARRNHPEADDREHEQSNVDPERRSRAVNEAPDDPSVTIADALESPVEGAEERAEQTIPEAPEPVLLGAVRLKKKRAHRWAERQRVERG